MTSLLRAAALLAAALAASPAAFAATSLVQNGDFEITTLSKSGQFTTEVTGWTNQKTTGYTGYGYNFLLTPGSADSTGFRSFGNNQDQLWGPGNGSNNGLTASSPSGGNFIAADGDVNFHGTISQTVNGLVVGTAYQLTFQYAGAQFYGYSGDTKSGWDVTFGSQTLSTPQLSNLSHGFTGWRNASLTFVATSTSQVLSFLAQGTPSGEPPTALLDHVALNAVPTSVPEPASMALLATGLAAAGFVSRRRRVALTPVLPGRPTPR